MKPIVILKRCKPLISLLILVIIFWIIKEKLSELSYQEIILSLSEIQKQNIFWAITCTLVGYFVIATYDLVALHHLNYKLDRFKGLSTAFSSYAIANNTGFALLIGGGIRYYFYNYYGVPNQIIAQVILMSNFNFWLGFISLGGIIFTLKPIVIPSILQTSILTVRPVGVILLLVLAIYFYFSWQQTALAIKGKQLLLPSWQISRDLIAISFVDRAIAALVLFILLPVHSDVGYVDFFGIYFLAIHAGIMSHIPGGVGIFEAVIVYLLPQSLDATEIIGSLIVFRVIYYLLPMAIAVIWIAIYEISLKKGIKKE